MSKAENPPLFNDCEMLAGILTTDITLRDLLVTSCLPGLLSRCEEYTPADAVRVALEAADLYLAARSQEAEHDGADS